MSFDDQQLRRSGTTKYEKQEKSSLFSNILKRITRSKTPKQTKEHNETFNNFMNNKSAVILKEHKSQIAAPTQQIQTKQKTLKNVSEIQSNKIKNEREEYLNQFQKSESQKKSNSEIVTPRHRQAKIFEPYSQQTALVDFLKREQNLSNGSALNKQNKQNKVQDEQIKAVQNDKVQQNEIQSFQMYIPPTDMTQALKQQKSQLGMNDISSLDMLADQTIAIDSNINRQINPDMSIKPVLYVETLESQVWMDDADQSQNIGYYTQTDEENRKKQRITNNQFQYQMHDKSISEDKRSEGFEQKSSNSNEESPNQQNIKQNGKKRDFIIQNSDDRESDDYNNINNQQNTNKQISDNNVEIQLDQYYNPYTQNKKLHLLKNIPLFISSENNNKQQLSNSINVINNDSKLPNTFFVKTSYIDKDNEEKQFQSQEELTLINKSIIEGVDKTFDIKVLLIDQQKDNQQIVNIKIDSLPHLKIVSNIYNSQSRDIPEFNFTDLSLQFADQNSSTVNKDILINIFQLKDSVQEQTYNFLRFQNFDECSQIFQDLLLQKLIQEQNYIPSILQKNIYFFQNKSDDIYLLQEVEEYITLSEIINFSNQKKLLLKKFKNDQILLLFQDILNVYTIYCQNQIALPNLSLDTIVIYYDSISLGFINLQNVSQIIFQQRFWVQIQLIYFFYIFLQLIYLFLQFKCHPLSNFSESQINQIRRKEREQLIIILKKLLKNLEINRIDIGVGSSNILTLNDQDNIDSQQLFYEYVFDQVLNGDIQKAIEKIQKQIQKITLSNNNESNLSQNIGNHSSIQNVSDFLQKIQKSYSQTSSQQNNNKINQLIEDHKKKRKFLSSYISVHENQIRTKKIRSENSNFQKCQKLTYLHQIYNSIFMKQQSLKTLEDLKNLKAECFGVDSNEYLKTLQILCKVYYSQAMYSQLVIHIEKYTEYLRNQFKPAFANELFHMCKVKLKMTKSQTVREDIQTLIEFLKQQNSNSSNSQKANENKYQFNLSKLYYQLGSCYNQIDELGLALENFKKCVAEISAEDNKNMNTKIQFYSLSNLARLYFKQKKNEEAKKILRNLQKSPIKFAYPIYYQYLGQIEFEDKNYELSFQFLHQCYILREKDSKCNRDYLELLLHYILVTLRIHGSQSEHFKKLCNEMKNFTGDYYNLDCLLIICNLLYEEKQFNLSQQKYIQAKGIMNLLIFSEKNNKALFKEYKKRMATIEEKLQKVFSQARSLQAK